jgi:dCMP deaminase
MRRDHDEYYMGIALAVRERANCLKSKVGAVLVLEDRVVSTGCNGTPQGMRNCEDGGCRRCSSGEDYAPGEGYDVCICVHAEQNCLLAAARFGIAVAGSLLYTTMRPCFGCLKELLQAGVQGIYYLYEWHYPGGEFATQYQALEKQFPAGVHNVNLQEPRAQQSDQERQC